MTGNDFLKPYAMTLENNGGRLHGNEPHPYRSIYQRDRDRIIHSKAFRRLGYKTQVFINSAGDNYRTRLTHSLEVAQIARSVSHTLGLNSDYSEALALAHDLGHTPFGHAGQEALNRLMADYGGFEHNRQSLRIVSFLETQYLDYNGLNLSRSVLKGMMKHQSVYDCDTDLLPLCQERKRESPCLEATLVDFCDQIAYVHHDLEDGLDARILNREMLDELPVWRDVWKKMELQAPNFRSARSPIKIRNVIREMMNECIEDLLANTRANLEALDLQSLQELQALEKDQYPVAFGAEMKARIAELRRFLFNHLYRYREVMKMSRRGAKIIEKLFAEYCSYPDLMPLHYQAKINSVGLERVVSDYISGMTDRFAQSEYSSLMGQKIV